MKKSIPILAGLALLCGVSVALGSATAHGSKSDENWCTGNEAKGETCRSHISDLRATQFAVGKVAVRCKRNTKIEMKSSVALRKYIDKENHHVPAVIAPDGGLYITDHHHFSTAIWQADIPDSEKVVTVAVVENWSDTDWDGFWDRMIKSESPEYYWPYDAKGLHPMSPDYLPKNMGVMHNDPFRTLSRWVRDSHGYIKCIPGDKGNSELCQHEPYSDQLKTPIYYLEFKWANFFRDNIDLTAYAEGKKCKAMNDQEKKERSNRRNLCSVDPNASNCLPDEVGALKCYFPVAMELANSAAAKDIPGWTDKKPSDKEVKEINKTGCEKD